MERKSVKSSNIASIGYDEESMTLEVEFNGGAVYQYTGVLPALHGSLMSAESKGKYFAQFVRDNHPMKKL